MSWIPIGKEKPKWDVLYWVLTADGKVNLCAWHDHQYFYPCAASYDGDFGVEDLDPPLYRVPVTNVIAYQPFDVKAPPAAEYEITFKEDVL